MSRITFGIIGAGWRAEFYTRIARALPDRFSISGVVVRDPQKRAAFGDRWGCPVFADAEALLAETSPAFVVTSLSWDSNPEIVVELVRAGMPVLSETPPAPDLEQLSALYRQVPPKITAECR